MKYGGWKDGRTDLALSLLPIGKGEQYDRVQRRARNGNNFPPTSIPLSNEHPTLRAARKRSHRRKRQIRQISRLARCTRAL